MRRPSEPTQTDMLIPEVVRWLHANTVRDGWRFVLAPVYSWVQRFRSNVTGQPRMIIIETVDIAHEVRFTRPNDALAFKMRWG